MEALDHMRNIGKEMKIKLLSIGIRSSKDLIRLGSKEVFMQLKERYPNVCLVHLYVLQGAIDNIDYDKLSEEVKSDLKQFSDSLK
ncbi:TfoX/Sxy family DNA transformation protein [Amedibacillus sp. YH-ame6]